MTKSHCSVAIFCGHLVGRWIPWLAPSTPNFSSAIQGPSSSIVLLRQKWVFHSIQICLVYLIPSLQIPISVSTNFSFQPLEQIFESSPKYKLPQIKASRLEKETNSILNIYTLMPSDREKQIYNCRFLFWANCLTYREHTGNISYRI